MMNKILITSLSFLLAACGTPKKSPDSNGGKLGSTSQGQQGGNPGEHLSQGDFQTKCAAQNVNSFISADNQYCVVPLEVSIPDGHSAGRVVIDPNFHAGKFIVSHGTNGAVILVLNGRRVGDANIRTLGPLENGALSFQILQPTGSQADATTYDCFDANMHAVYCESKIIP
jgi:hypothetical protein